MRSKFQIIYLMLAPIFLLCLVRFFQSISNDFMTKGVGTTKESKINSIEKCFHPTDPCITIGYGIIGDIIDNEGKYNWIHNTMRYLAEENNLEYRKDVKLISLGTSINFKNYIVQNMNKTTFGVLFCTTDWIHRVDISNTTMAKYSKYENFDINLPCTIDKTEGLLRTYSVMYNFTLIPFEYMNIVDLLRWNTLTRIT